MAHEPCLAHSLGGAAVGMISPRNAVNQMKCFNFPEPRQASANFAGRRGGYRTLPSPPERVNVIMSNIAVACSPLLIGMPVRLRSAHPCLLALLLSKTSSTMTEAATTTENSGQIANTKIGRNPEHSTE